MSDVCSVVKKNLGISKCNKLPGYIRGMITTPANFKASPTQAIDPDFWQDAIEDTIANRIYLWPDFFGSANSSEATIYETTPLGKRRVRDGFYEFDITISRNLCIHKAMYSHRATGGRVFLIDTDNQIIGTLDANGNLQGFTIQMLNTEKMTFNDGTVSSKSPVKLVLQNNLEFDQNGSLLDASSFVNTLLRLTDVTLTIVSAISTKIVVTVAATCDGTPLNGLIKADFVLLDQTGAAQTISGTVTEVNGTYTINGSGFVAGTLNLVTPDVLSIESYESTPVFVLGGS